MVRREGESYENGEMHREIKLMETKPKKRDEEGLHNRGENVKNIKRKLN